QLGRYIVSCDPAKQVTITKIQRAEFRLANMDCISEHCLENGFQLGGRTADDLQHLGCRALLLPRLGEFTRQAVELFLHIGGPGTPPARGSGLLAAFELRRLTVAHFHMRRSSLPRPTTDAIDVRRADASHGAPPTTFRITPEAPKLYHLHAEIERGLDRGWRTRAQCAVLRPRMTGLGQTRPFRRCRLNVRFARNRTRLGD